MRNKLLLFYIIIVIKTNIAFATSNATSNINITPSGQVSAIIDQWLNFTCTAKLMDAQGRSLNLLTFGQVGIAWPQYFLVLSSNQDYLVDHSGQGTVNSYYNKSSTDMVMKITIKNITKYHFGIYKCAASYLSDGELQDEVVVKVNVLAPPRRPKDFEVVNRVNSSIQLAWSEVDGQKSGIHYVIDCVSFNLPRHSINAVSNKTSIVLNDLVLTNCYICTLLAKNNIGNSSSLSLFIAADHPHQCCRSSSNTSPSKATSVMESRMTTTTTSHIINTPTTIPLQIQPTTVSTSVPNQSTVDSSSMVTITTTQTKFDLLNTTTSHMVPPTSSHDNLPGQGSTNTTLNTTVTVTSNTKAKTTSALIIGISLGFCAIVVLGGITYHKIKKRIRSVNNTLWPSSYPVSLDRLPYNKATTDFQGKKAHDSRENLVSIEA